MIPEIDVIPYKDPLMDVEDPVIPGSMGVSEGMELGKEFDFDDNEDYEADLWASDRQGFGLQDWNEEE